MAIRSNPYFNNPQFAQAASNLAGLFAPPSGAEASGWANANATKQKAAMLAQLFNNPDDPNFDRRNIAVGNYNPTQSFYAQDQNNATTMRGQDVTAGTSRANNAADNALALQTTKLDGLAGFYDALNPGQVRPELPPEIAAQFGVEAVPGAVGAPKPLSETEWNAQQQARLLTEGQLTDDDLLNSIIGDQTPLQAVGPDGTPVYMNPGAAVRGGAQPYNNPGATAKPENGMAVLADGTQVPARQDVNTGIWSHAQTGEQLPADVKIYKTPAPTGTNEDLGVGKPVSNNIEKQLVDLAIAKDTATSLLGLIESSPASQGAVGWLRGTTQNVLATGGELGEYFGGGIADVNNAIREGAADASLASAFDENIPAIEMLANLLAFQYAKTTTGERLSNEMLRASRAALGLDGLTANQQASMASIGQAIEQMERQETILRDIRTNGVGAGQPGAAPGAPAPMPQAPGGAVPEGVDPADWEYMTPEQRSLFQ